MSEIRNYKFSVELKYGSRDETFDTVIEAYDLQEALIQFGIKYQEYGGAAKILEIIPFKYIEEQKPVVEQKKEVHVKPLPKMYIKDIPPVQEPFEGDTMPHPSWYGKMKAETEEMESQKWPIKSSDTD